jgi:hypothetical protein
VTQPNRITRSPTPDVVVDRFEDDWPDAIVRFAARKTQTGAFAAGLLTGAALLAMIIGVAA